MDNLFAVICGAGVVWYLALPEERRQHPGSFALCLIGVGLALFG